MVPHYHYPPPFWTLPPSLESEHFIIHFVPRDLGNGPGNGTNGVRNEALVLTYIDALERLYRTMRSPPWNREPPIVDETRKTHVYVCNYEALTFDEPLAPPGVSTSIPAGYPYILLPNRCWEPTIQAELHKAAAEATHEATHVFNYTQRQFHDRVTTHPWRWFDEAFAVFMEMHLLTGNQDCFRYFMDWIDKPEIPLDAYHAMYQAGMFIRYLSNVPGLGLGFINDVWTKSHKKEKPLEALDRLLMAKGLTLASSDPNTQDIFGSGYCLEPYFLWHHNSPSLAPDVLVRYGERAISESFELSAGKPRQAKGVVDHLACRYYRFYLRNGITTLGVRLEVDTPTSLKGEIVVIEKNRQRAVTQPLHPLAVDEANGRVDLAIQLNHLVPDDIDHIVLVVSNCGLRAAQDDEEIAHDDGKIFTLCAQV